LNQVRTIEWAKWEGAGLNDLLSDFRFRIALALSGIAALLLYASSTSPKALFRVLTKFGRTSYQGRIGRLHWWTYTIAVLAAENLVYSLLFFADRFEWPIGVQVIFVALSYALYGTVYWYAVFSIKRLHDRNRPGWRAVFWFAPWIVYMGADSLQRMAPDWFEPLALYFGIAFVLSAGIWVWTSIGLGFRRGTLGANRFGSEDEYPPPEVTLGAGQIPQMNLLK
jgi:uncharacterized membrane protein YhaH (DUF805 family)